MSEPLSTRVNDALRVMAMHLKSMDNEEDFLANVKNILEPAEDASGDTDSGESSDEALISL